MGDHGKINSKHRLLKKKVNFLKLETNLMKKVVYFFLAGVGVFVQVSMLGALCNNKVIDFWPLPLDHYLEIVLIIHYAPTEQRMAHEVKC